MSESPAHGATSSVARTSVNGTRTDTAADQGYFPLHPAHLDGADGVVFVREV